MTAWIPVLDDLAAARGREIVDHIARALESPPVPYDGAIEDDGLRAALFSREPGFAVFYTYLARSRGHDSVLLERAIEFLSAGLDRIEQIASYRPFFSFGFAGTAWAYEHLRADLDPPDAAKGQEEGDLLEDIDGALGELVQLQETAYDHGIISGLVGYGIYAIERLPRPIARQILERICGLLVDIKQADSRGCCWPLSGRLVPTPEGVPGDDIYATGIESGTGGVVALLGQAQRVGIEVEGLEGAVRDGIRWLEAVSEEYGFLPKAVGSKSGGFGWTGLAGTVAALWAIERGHVPWITSLADELVQQDPADTRCASLKDGAAGTAHGLNRLYQRTGDTNLLEAARRWFERVIELYDPTISLGGYRFYSPEWEKKYLPDVPTGDLELPGVANGVAGIGLALLAAITPVEPSWDRMFLLSGRDLP